jgi:alkylation response protein AidB-like acyl-CoA dehydrogenase
VWARNLAENGAI